MQCLMSAIYSLPPPHWCLYTCCCICCCITCICHCHFDEIQWLMVMMMFFSYNWLAVGRFPWRILSGIIFRIILRSSTVLCFVYVGGYKYIKYIKYHCSIDATKYYFSNRIVHIWKSNDIVFALSVSSFKSRLLKFELSI